MLNGLFFGLASGLEFVSLHVKGVIRLECVSLHVKGVIWLHCVSLHVNGVIRLQFVIVKGSIMLCVCQTKC